MEMKSSSITDQIDRLYSTENELVWHYTFTVE